MDPTAHSTHSPHVLVLPDEASASASPSASPPPKKTSAKWQNAAMKANPKLDSDRLAEISSKRLSKVKVQDSSSVSLMEIASRHLVVCMENVLLDMQPAPCVTQPSSIDAHQLGVNDAFRC